MIAFKTNREEKEYHELPVHNARLYNLLRVVESFCELEFSKAITITSIFRTQAEHDAIYKNTSNPPASSVHCQWEGLDLRSTDFTAAEITRLVAFLNQFKFRNGKTVGLFHEIPPHGAHLHIQYGKSK